MGDTVEGLQNVHKNSPNKVIALPLHFWETTLFYIIVNQLW